MDQVISSFFYLSFLLLPLFLPSPCNFDPGKNKNLWKQMHLSQSLTHHTIESSYIPWFVSLNRIYLFVVINFSLFLSLLRFSISLFCLPFLPLITWLPKTNSSTRDDQLFSPSFHVIPKTFNRFFCSSSRKKREEERGRKRSSQQSNLFLLWQVSEKRMMKGEERKGRKKKKKSNWMYQKRGITLGKSKNISWWSNLLLGSG